MNYIDTVNSFVDDREKMRDFYFLSKDEFLESYSYLTEEEYNATAKAANFLIDSLFLLDSCKKLLRMAKRLQNRELLELARDIMTTAELVVFPETEAAE